jgi:hypothetical protein
MFSLTDVLGARSGAPSAKSALNALIVTGFPTRPARSGNAETLVSAKDTRVLM